MQNEGLYASKVLKFPAPIRATSARHFDERAYPRLALALTDLDNRASKARLVSSERKALISAIALSGP